MKNQLIAASIALSFLACSNEQPEDGGQQFPAFQTTAPSQLYFKNMRSTYYRQTVKAGSRTDLYRLRSFSDTEQRPLIYPVIANNWMADEAYLLIETNDYVGGWPDTLQIKWQSDADSGRLELPTARLKEQYQFALQLNEKIRQNHDLRIKKADGAWVPLFENQKDRRNYQTTLNDYRRLTEK